MPPLLMIISYSNLAHKATAAFGGNSISTLLIFSLMGLVALKPVKSNNSSSSCHDEQWHGGKWTSNGFEPDSTRCDTTLTNWTENRVRNCLAGKNLYFIGDSHQRNMFFCFLTFVDHRLQRLKGCEISRLLTIVDEETYSRADDRNPKSPDCLCKARDFAYLDTANNMNLTFLWMPSGSPEKVAKAKSIPSNRSKGQHLKYFERYFQGRRRNESTLKAIANWEPHAHAVLVGGYIRSSNDASLLTKAWGSDKDSLDQYRKQGITVSGQSLFAKQYYELHDRAFPDHISGNPLETQVLYTLGVLAEIVCPSL